MQSFRKKWMAYGISAVCIVSVSSLTCAAEVNAAMDLTATSAEPILFQDCVAVDNTVLGEMRGGFDIAPGLKVSFGIERIVNLNGVLQTATRIEVPDAGKLIQAQQSSAAASSQSGIAAPAASAMVPLPANISTSDGKINLPAPVNLGGGATALVQNGLGNTGAPGPMSPDAAATFIQNSANNQTIQSMTVINAATNSLELLKGANLQSTLLDVLTQSAGTR